MGHTTMSGRDEGGIQRNPVSNKVKSHWDKGKFSWIEEIFSGPSAAKLLV